MKKPLKVSLISLGSLIVLAMVAAAVAVWVVFTPTRLTPIVREQAGKYLTCGSEIGNVDLTFFSTFPEFGLRMSDVVLTHPKEGAQSDTLASLKSCVAIVDVMAFVNDRKVDIKRFEIEEGQANLFCAADGTTNYDIVSTTSDTPADAESSSFSLDQLSLTGVSVRHLDFSYVDEAAHLKSEIRDVELNLAADQSLVAMTGDIDLKLSVAGVRLCLADSLPMDVDLSGFALNTRLNTSAHEIQADRLKLQFDTVSYADAAMQVQCRGLDLAVERLQLGSTIGLSLRTAFESLHFAMLGSSPMAATLGASTLQFPEISCRGDWTVRTDCEFSDVLFTMGQEIYVDHHPLGVALSASADSAFTHFMIDSATVAFADQHLALSADVRLADSLHTTADVAFSLDRTTFGRLLALVPAAVASSLKQIDVDGSVALQGSASVSQSGDVVAIPAFSISTDLKDLRFKMDDRIFLESSSLTLAGNYPVAPHKQVKKKRATAQLIGAELQSTDLHFAMTDSSRMEATLKQLSLNGILSDEVLTDTTQIPFVMADFAFAQLDAAIDTISVATTGSKGRVTLDPAKRRTKKYYKIEYANETLDLRMGRDMHAATGALAINAGAVYDAHQTDFLLQYNPTLDVDLKQAQVDLSSMPYPIEIPTIDFNFSLGRFLINDSRVKLGNSDFELKGDVKNIREYLKKEGLLTASLDFTSETTDVEQLMDLVNGLGVSDSAATADVTSEVAVTDSAATLGDPFMVPMGVDVELNTHIQHALVGANDFTNLGGRVTIKDGNLVLEEMGFSNKAARMQLTALYRSAYRDHLFVSLNFHLLDIEIADLLHMIPDIDTIVPMLKSFDGKAEFHLAAETNMKANYDLKMSTLKATAAIEGKDLILMDNATFSTIAKYLMFNKKTKNKVDSISVEMAVARRKATIYPFLISMDKYQAVVSGTHNLSGNMGLNYHISITDCPLPVRLGLDVTGDMEHLDNIGFALAKCKYANLYKPAKRNATQAQTLELKSLISTALKRTVKDQPLSPTDSAAPTTITPIVNDENPL